MDDLVANGSRGRAAAGGGALTPLAAWALAFGCAVGWDALVMPGSTFLPKAGPLGTLLGVLLGGLVMGVVAWNYHVMINRHPGPGGVYAYAGESFGVDHGFIAGWFLCLTYMAIVWMDATVISSVARHLAGRDLFAFGFRYTVAGYHENGAITTAFDMRVLNQIDRCHIVQNVLNATTPNPALFRAMDAQLQQHRAYILAHGIDPDWVKNF